MKRSLAIMIGLLTLCATYGQPVQLYLGLRGGAGAMLTRDQLYNVGTPDGPRTIFKSEQGWSAHAKGEALLGFRRLRIGYQFLYNFAAPGLSNNNIAPQLDNGRYTTYFNNSQAHFFGHYFLAELAIINTKRFALTPGIAVGSFTGYKVDNNTGEVVQLSADTHHRFSVGGELNAEIKFAKRCTFLIGPNYYMFSLQDKAHPDWREYQHFIGADIGLRVNLLKL
ncbi:MAG: hypothetical protein JWO06_2328 [Bacteroidota bacterium]|nr:hypothetical protein [Bacteroidota bacterium]